MNPLVTNAVLALAVLAVALFALKSTGPHGAAGFFGDFASACAGANHSAWAAAPRSHLRGVQDGGGLRPSNVMHAESDPDAVPDAATMTEPEFRRTVLKGVSGQAKQIAEQKRGVDKLLTDTERLSTETKESIKELQRSANDQDKATKAVQKALLSLRREERSSFGTPGGRISADPELRKVFNAVFRYAASQPGDHVRKLAEKMYPDVDAAVRSLNAGFHNQRDITEGSSPGADFIVEHILPEIYDTLMRYGDWPTLGVRPVSTKQTKTIVQTARPSFQWMKPRSTPITPDAAFATTPVELEVEAGASLVDVDLEQLQDSELDLTPVIMDSMTEAVNLGLDSAFFLGEGDDDDDNANFTGAFNFGTAVTADAGHTTVASLTLSDFVKCLTGVAGIVLKSRRPCWWVHPTMLARILGVKDTTGRPLFQSAFEAPSYGAIGTILGFPVKVIGVAPNTDGASNQVIMFGDPQAYIVGMRKDIAFEASDIPKWTQLQRSFRTWVRAGGVGRRANGLAVLSTAAS